MQLTAQLVKALIEAIAATYEEESPCDDCLQRMAAFADAELSGKSIPDALARVRVHLDRCRECREEYEALRRALEEIEEGVGDFRTTLEPA